MRNSSRAVWLTLLVFAAIDCGGGTDEGGGGGGGTGFTARIDGQSWEASEISLVAQTLPAAPGTFQVLGSQTTGNTTRSLRVTVMNVSGPGTYPLGVGSEMYGGTASVGEGTGGPNSNNWVTPGNGIAGSITITRLSGGRLEATFSYVAEPGQQNTVGGTRTVTNGEIDVALSGTLAAVPPNVGSRMTGTFNGQPYGASSASGLLQDHLGQPGITISTISSENSLSILLSGVTAPGTFTLSNTAPVRSLSAGRNTHPINCCWGGGGAAGDVATITITSISATRIQGTFSGTLQPTPGRPATTPLVITNGSFDVGVD